MVINHTNPRFERSAISLAMVHADGIIGQASCTDYCPADIISNELRWLVGILSVVLRSGMFLLW